MKRALPSDTLFQPCLKQQNEIGSEVNYIFKVLFVQHTELYLSYTLSFINLTNIYIIRNSYVKLQIQSVKIYVIKKILTKWIIQSTNVSMLTSPLAGSLLQIIAVYVHVYISNKMRHLLTRNYVWISLLNHVHTSHVTNPIFCYFKGGSEIKFIVHPRTGH